MRDRQHTSYLSIESYSSFKNQRTSSLFFDCRLHQFSSNVKYINIFRIFNLPYIHFQTRFYNFLYFLFLSLTLTFCYTNCIAAANLKIDFAFYANKFQLQLQARLQLYGYSSTDFLYCKNRGTADSPKMVYDYLSKRIYKQNAAIKAASLFLFKHVNHFGKTRFSLFCGPTGSGKTYPWDVIRQNLFPHIIFVNSSNITRLGFKDPNITDNLSKINPHSHWAPIFIFLKQISQYSHPIPPAVSRNTPGGRFFYQFLQRNDVPS